MAIIDKDIRRRLEQLGTDGMYQVVASISHGEIQITHATAFAPDTDGDAFDLANYSHTKGAGVEKQLSDFIQLTKEVLEGSKSKPA